MRNYFFPKKPHSEGNWQNVCFTDQRRFSSDIIFKCNSRQCLDIADYLDETALFRKHAWADVRIHALNCKHAIMEFCHAFLEAKLFLEECSSAADFCKSAHKSLTKLHTGDAYDVLLHNIIWSKAGLDLALLYAGNSTNIEYDKEIGKRVEECNRMLSRYCTPASTEAHLDADRTQFYLSVEKLRIRDESQKKCLNFLVGKSAKAYLQGQQSDEETKSGDGGRAQVLFDAFQIDPHDLDGPEHVLAGGGASGLVYRRSWLGQNVAVKVFNGVPPEVFKEEASLLAGLQNPFIVQMVGWCIDENGTCMLVMEQAPTDLKKKIDQQPSSIISLPAAVDIMLQISKAMEYLDKRKIVHRDVKPNNVLLQPSSVKEMAAEGYARVKLCDFGIAKVKALSAADRSKYTTAKKGTSYYRAPEVLFDEDDADKIKYNRKVDVFSFAITCSEILAGKTGPTCYENIPPRKVRERMLANVRPNLPLDCPSHLANLIKSCWDTDPDRRPPFSRVSNTLTYIKFILMRVSDVSPYDSVVKGFDEAEMKRLVSGDEEFVDTGGSTSYSAAGAGEEDSAQDNLDYNTRNISAVADFAGTRSHLKSGESLKTHQYIMCNGYKFVMQEGGILVLYPLPSGDAMWASYTEKQEDACNCVLEEDGNLVMYNSKNHVVWSSNSGREKAAYKLELENRRAVIRGPEGKDIWATDESVERSSMRSGQFLVTHQWMLCKGYKLEMQGDSNLVLRSPSDKPLWASKTVHPGGGGRYICRLQNDGNLVICDSKWRDNNASVVRAVWSSNSSSALRGVYKLELDGGRAVIRNPQGELIWATS